MEATYESNERRSETTTLFLLKKISKQQTQSSHVLRAHTTQEDLRFDQILRGIHELRAEQLIAVEISANAQPGLFSADLRPLKVITAVGYLLMALSLFMYHPGMDPANDLKYLTSVFPVGMWALLFALMFMFRLAGLASAKGSKFLHLAVPILGLWLWSMVFVSFALLSPIESVSMLLSLPILMEMWVLSRSYAKWRKPNGTAGNL